MSDMGWTEYISGCEKDNYLSCVRCAKASGYTEEEAENCDSGELDCKNCPWGGKSK